MPHYVMLTRVSTEAIAEPAIFEDLNRRIGARIRQECPEVRWLANYTVLGPYDYLDIFDAPDNESAAKVALIIRSFGHASTEIWPAMTWERFREITDGSAA